MAVLPREVLRLQEMRDTFFQWSAPMFGMG